jgi:iron complex outermembrane receptor protein
MPAQGRLHLLFYPSLQTGIPHYLFTSLIWTKNNVGMKKQVCFLSMIFLSLGINAQQLTGTVSDQQTGQPVSFATITLGNGKTIQTQGDGSFLVDRLPNNRSVSISSVGYRILRDTLNPNSSNAFKLTRYELFMQPVEISATRAGDKAPFTKTNISKTK